jgi:hypothetical protein
MDYLMDESLSYTGRWLRMMKQVIRGLNWFKKSAILSFAFNAIEVDGNISFEVFCGFASHDAFKKITHF